MTKQQYEQATKNARLAFSLMGQHQVTPSPRNYAVWFEYAGAKNQDLVHEIDRYVNEDRPFSDEANEDLYRRFIGQDYDKRTVEESSQRAKELLAQIAQMIDAVSSDSAGYGKELDGFTNKLATHLTDDSLKPVIESIISKTRSIRQRSSDMNKRLTDSSEEIRTLRRNLEQVTVESTKDFLTGVSNRKVFDAEIKAKIQEARKNDKPLSLLMLDIDHFKKFNDKHGHQLGDEVLRLVAKSITGVVRGNDVVARYGGEEFSVLLPDTPLAGALVVAEKIRKSIAERSLKRKDTGETIAVVTVSIGVSTMNSVDDSETLTWRADEALYKSKNGGRNKVTQESAAA